MINVIEIFTQIPHKMIRYIITSKKQNKTIKSAPQNVLPNYFKDQNSRFSLLRVIK